MNCKYYLKKYKHEIDAISKKASKNLVNQDVSAIIYDITKDFIKKEYNISSDYIDILKNKIAKLQIDDECKAAAYMYKNVLDIALSKGSIYEYETYDEVMDDINNILSYIKYIDEGKLLEENTNDENPESKGALQIAYYMNVPIDIEIEDIKKVSVEYIKHVVDVLRKQTLRNYVPANRNKYVCDILKEKEELLDNSYRSKLNYILLSCYNYRGETQDAIKLFEDANKNNAIDKNEDYHSIINRMVTSYIDVYSIKKAEKLAEYNIKKLEKYKSEDHYEFYYRDLANAYSSMGQLMAIKGMDAMECFEKSLEVNQKNGYANNANITISHILNYAVLSGDKNLFEKYMPDYFRMSDIDKVIKNVFLGNEVTNMYEVLTLLRSIKKFYVKDIDKKLCSKLCEKFEEYIETKYFYNIDTNDHVIKLIYLYIAMILLEVNSDKYEEQAKESFELAIAWPYNGIADFDADFNILSAISFNIFGIMNTYDKYKDDKKYEAVKNVFEKSIAKAGSIWKGLRKRYEKNGRLDKLLVYEHI